MSKIRFMWDNEADAATITSSTEHTNFPDDNVVHRWHTRPWRSNYGAGSGWGRFVITAASNDRIDFDEGGGEITANLTPGVYTADSLAAHLKVIMDVASGAHTYTWEYLDGSNKFKCTDGTGNFQFLWLNGTNVARSVGPVIGADMTADAPNPAGPIWTADYIRIHNAEWLVFDFGSAQSVQSFVLRNNNFQSGATVRIQGHTANTWAAPSVTYTFGTIDNDIMVYFWASVQSYQYWRIYINDIDNPDGYVEMGRVFLGSYFSPTRGFKEEYGDNILDPSDVMFSKGGQISSNEEDEYVSVDLSFPAATADFATFKSMFNDRGRRKDMFVCLDTDNFATETYYMRFASQFNASHMWNREYYWVQTQLEELR